MSNGKIILEKNLEILKNLNICPPYDLVILYTGMRKRNVKIYAYRLSINIHGNFLEQRKYPQTEKNIFKLQHNH